MELNIGFLTETNVNRTTVPYYKVQVIYAEIDFIRNTTLGSISKRVMHIYVCVYLLLRYRRFS